MDREPRMAAISHIAKEENHMQRTHFGGPFEAERAYSPVVKTVGGAHLWVAGQTGLRDDAGKFLTGDFEAQTRQCFKAIAAQLAKGLQATDAACLGAYLHGLAADLAAELEVGTEGMVAGDVLRYLPVAIERLKTDDEDDEDEEDHHHG